jgi:chromatin remodeling complex protein RSC6
MARATKNTTTTPTATTPTAKTTATPVKTTTAKTTKSTKKETAPAPTPAPVVETSTEEQAAAPVTIPVLDQFSEFMAKLQAFSAQMSSLRTEFRGLERQVARDLKAAAKITAKRKRKVGNRAPSGFVKPTLISNELADFLGKPVGTEMARTEVTREINAYIREHKLQDKDNGRKIIADKKLTGLLKLKKGDELTYFNLQKYMSPHFAKAGDKVAAADNA